MLQPNHNFRPLMLVGRWSAFAGAASVTELPEQIGRRKIPPPFGTPLLFPQLGTFLSKKFLY
jgi:hypothetical protein